MLTVMLLQSMSPWVWCPITGWQFIDMMKMSPQNMLKCSNNNSNIRPIDNQNVYLQWCGYVLKYHETYGAKCLVSWQCSCGMLEADGQLNPLATRLEQAILFLLLLCRCLGFPIPKSGWCSTSVICSISHQRCSISIRSYTSSLPSINTGKNTCRNVGKKEKTKLR